MARESRTTGIIVLRHMLCHLRSSMIVRYGLSIFSVAISLVATLLLQSYVFRTPLFFLSIMISTWVGGIGPGLLTVVLSSVSISLFLSPQGVVTTRFHDIPNIIAFLVTALLVASWAAARRRGVAPWREDALRRGYRSAVALPLQDENAHTFGALSVYSVEPDFFTAGELRLLEELAGDLAFGIATLHTRAERKRTGEALRQSERNFRTLAEKSLQGIVIFQDQKIVYANPAQSAIVGYTIEELKSMSVEQFISMIHPLDRAMTVEGVRKRMAGEQISPSVELRMVRKDGATRWLQSFSNPIEYNGQPALLNATIDITERRQAQEALRRTEELFRAIVEDQTEMIVRWKPDGTRTFVNKAYCRTFGKSYDELVGTTFWPLVAEPDRERELERIRNLTRDSPYSMGLHESLLPDGKTQWQEWSDRGLFDEQGRLVELQSVGRDITERKQAEEQIRQHAARMETLAEISRAFVEAGLDYQSVLNTVARRTAELIGDACVITLFSDDRQRAFPVAFYHPDPKAHSLMQDALLHTWQGGTDTERFRTLLSGESMYIPVVDSDTYRAATEPEFWLYVDHIGVSSVLVVPLRTQDHVIGTLGITRDRQGAAYTSDDQVLVQDLADRAALTIQNAQLFEQVQGAQERLQALSRQVLQAQEVERRSIARELHDEIGQVLTAVSTNLQTIQLSSDPAILAERLKESVDLVDEAIRQIRDLSLDLRPSMLDDFGLVPALEWFVDRQAQRSGFRVEWIVEPSELRMPANLETTVFRVAQIALTNVARHAQAKQVQIELRQHEAELELVIRDDGIGFDVGAALERASHGTTLGLLSMQERVRLVGGALDMTSTPGLGTEIRARFPVGRENVP